MAKKKEKELVYDWTRKRPRNDDFKCGWCVYYEPAMEQDEVVADGDDTFEFDGEVFDVGHCRCNPPTPVCASDPHDKLLETAHVGNIAVDFVWPNVWRHFTACKNFKSCFRKKGKDGEEKKGGAK